jgi:hypothetical protein
MPRRYRQFRMRDPDVFLLLPATPLVHRHPRILRTFPVDHTSFCFMYPDLHHRLLGSFTSRSARFRKFETFRKLEIRVSIKAAIFNSLVLAPRLH